MLLYLKREVVSDQRAYERIAMAILRTVAIETESDEREARLHEAEGCIDVDHFLFFFIFGVAFV